LGKPGVDRGKAAYDSFISGEMFKPGICRSEVADGEQEEED